MNRIEEIEERLYNTAKGIANVYNMGRPDLISISEIERANDIEYLLAENKKYKEALQRLDRVLKFDYEQETWVDKERLKLCTSGTEIALLNTHYEFIESLNEAKRFARRVLKEE